jgi:glycyl-tRNA synthetase (class II)
MSQVVRAIESVDTGERKIFRDGFSPLFQDVFSAKSTLQELRGLDEVAKEYRIGVTIGSQVFVSELEAMNENALTEAIKRTKRHVIEAIFGEFRQDLMMIERALYDRDFQKSRDYLRILEQKMFSTE